MRTLTVKDKLIPRADIRRHDEAELSGERAGGQIRLIRRCVGTISPLRVKLSGSFRCWSQILIFYRERGDPCKWTGCWHGIVKELGVW